MHLDETNSQSSGQHSAVSAQAMDQTRDIEKHEAALPPLNSPHHQGKGNNTDSAEQHESMYNSDGDPHVNDLDPAAARLATDLTPLSLDNFYSLMGVRPPTTPQEALVKLAHPHGLYGQIHRDMLYNNRKFKAVRKSMGRTLFKYLLRMLIPSFRFSSILLRITC